MSIKIDDISVLVTCYCEGDLLLRAIESLKNQTIQGFEVVIVNDCSKDELTNKICNDFRIEEKYRVIFRTENGGLSAARNTAFENMNGVFAIPLDADDTLPEDCVENVLNILNNNSNIDMIFGDYSIINEKSECDVVDCSVLANSVGKLDIYKLANNWILLGTSPCSKNIWHKINGYNLKFSNTNQDVDFWRRAFLSNCVGFYLKKCIYNWYKLDTGMNSNVNEENYLELRIDSLQFYDQYNFEYGLKMRDYIYRYYSSRLMYEELKDFVNRNSLYFNFIHKIKVSLMKYKSIYKIIRKTKNIFKK